MAQVMHTQLGQSFDAGIFWQQQVRQECWGCIGIALLAVRSVTARLWLLCTYRVPAANSAPHAFYSSLTAAHHLRQVVNVSTPCRFDEECRAQVADNMRGRGVHIYSETIPIK